MEKNLDDKTALAELKKGYGKAKTLLDDVDELERFLQRLEKKLKTIPVAGDKLAVLLSFIFITSLFITIIFI